MLGALGKRLPNSAQNIFVAAGVGAIPRPGQEKARDIVSAFDYMTAEQVADVQTGSPRLDVTSKIQAADDAASAVYFPPGTYGVATTSSLGVGRNTTGKRTWYGAGQQVSVLKALAARSIVVNNFACGDIFLRDLGFNGADIAPYCLDIGDGATGISNVSLDRCWFSQNTTANVRFRKVSYSYVKQCYFRYCEVAGAGLGLSLDNCTFISITGECQFLAHGIALNISNVSAGIRVSDVDMYSSQTANAAANFINVKDSNHVWFNRVSLENLMKFTGPLVLLRTPTGGQATSDITFTDCYALGLPYDNHIFQLQNGVKSVTFERVSAIKPSTYPTYAVLDNNATAANIVVKRCLALANYTDASEQRWTTFTCNVAANCVTQFDDGAFVLNFQNNAGGVGNGADLTDDTLFTFTMPANMLIHKGQKLRIRASLSTAVNGNNKRYKIWVGGVVVADSGVIVSNAQAASIEAEVTALSLIAIHGIGSFSVNGAAGTVNTTTTSAVANLDINTTIIKVTGASPTTGAANDAVAYAMSTTLVN